jgi:transglutaminase-like putative cysteine protease
MKKIFSLFLSFIFILCSFFLPLTLSAQEQATQFFESSLNNIYTVQPSGETLVQHTFRIRNLTPTYFVNRHGLRISSSDIKSIKVSGASGEIPAEITQTENQTNIGITFPDKLVGENKVREFTITYVNPDLAQIQGRVLEVAIPKQADPQQYQAITVTLNTPLLYGEPSRVTPASNYAVGFRNQQVQLTFSDLHGEGISALFGTEQVFDLDFEYFLENADSQPVLLQVALPPDMPHQRMYYEQLEPRPEKIERDEDGNWIATFYMSGRSTQIVKASALALLTLEPNGTVPEIAPQSYHIQSQPFWETGNQNIQELARQYTDPKSIYDYVTANLEYAAIESPDQLQRLGAVKVLETPLAAACQEFSDLFVALARANRIPARVITGYAYTQNNALRPLSLADDILHAWPEFWDSGTNSWKAVDPTWENTTGGVDYFNQFDLNHIALAINGRSSTLPYPAGAYRDPAKTEKSLNVTFGTAFPVLTPEVHAALSPRQTAIVPLPGFYELRLENPTGAALYDIRFDVSAAQSHVTVFGEKTISALLPYQSVTLPLFVYNTHGAWWQSDQLTLSVNHGEEIITEEHVEVKNAPQAAQYLAHPYALIGVVSGVVVVALTAGSLLVFRRKR